MAHFQARQVLRAKGHKLSLEWSGERGAESSSTGRCSCGEWEEAASSQGEVRHEYRWHLARVLNLRWSIQLGRFVPASHYTVVEQKDDA